MAAECAFGAIDERIHAEFDYDTGHHRYAGVIDKVKKAFDDDLKKAETYFNQLQEVITKFESRPWSVAAKARQGSLYDSCRTGLYNARPPGLKLYTDKEEKLLKLAETSAREDLQEQADAIRQKRREDWRGARERSLNDADKAMVKFYTEAVVFGRAFKVRNAAVDTRHPAAGVLHQHPRRREAPRVQPGRRRSRDQGARSSTRTASSCGPGRAWRRRSSPTNSPRRSRSFHEGRLISRRSQPSSSPPSSPPAATTRRRRCRPSPSSAGSNPTPGRPQVGMSDAPSSARIGETPAPSAPRPALTGQASGVYQQALQAFAKGDLRAAKGLFEQATQAEPALAPGVLLARRRAGAAQGSRAPPRATGRRSRWCPTTSRPSSPTRCSSRRRGSSPRPIASSPRSAARCPRAPRSPPTLAEVKSLQKDTGSAQRFAQEALKINPDYRPAMVIIARDHYRNRRLDLALYALQAILDGFEPVAENPPRDKDNGEALLLRGLIWKEQKQPLRRHGPVPQGGRSAARTWSRRGSSSARRCSRPAAPTRLCPSSRARCATTPTTSAGTSTWATPTASCSAHGDAKREFEWVLAHDASLPQVHYDLGLLYLYAPSIPGMTAKQQIGEAIRELTKFREVRARDEKDDSEELLNSAKIKEGELAAASAPVAPPPLPPPPAAPPPASPAAAPKDGGAPASAASAATSAKAGGGAATTDGGAAAPKH